MNTVACLVMVLFLVYISETKRPYCKPGRKFYNPLLKKCQRCPDNCPDGTTMNESAPLNISKEFGALDCYPCVKCPDGEYSTTDTQGVCVECYNCTEMENRYTKFPCDGTRNANCGDCLPMFYESAFMKGFGPCSKCSESTANIPSCAKFASKTQSTPIQHYFTTTDATPRLIDKVLNHTNESRIILVIAVCVVALIGIVYFLYKLYKCLQMACSRNDDNFGTYTTVASVSSNERLKSLLKVPEDQGLPNDDLQTDCDVADETLSDAEYKTSLILEDEYLEYLRTVSRFIDKSADLLYNNLDIDGGRRHDLNCKHGTDPMEEKFQALKYWVRKEGANATFGRLYDALKDGGYNLACKKLLEAMRKRERHSSMELVI